MSSWRKCWLQCWSRCWIRLYDKSLKRKVVQELVIESVHTSCQPYIMHMHACLTAYYRILLLYSYTYLRYVPLDSLLDVLLVPVLVLLASLEKDLDVQDKVQEQQDNTDWHAQAQVLYIEV